jgi:hypothetical protein
MRRGLLAGFAVVSTACASDAIPSPVEPSITASAPARAATQGAIADLTTRIIPASDRLLASAALSDAVSAVNSAIERSNAKALTHVARSCRTRRRSPGECGWH